MFTSPECGKLGWSSLSACCHQAWLVWIVNSAAARSLGVHGSCKLLVLAADLAIANLASEGRARGPGPGHQHGSGINMLILALAITAACL